MESPCCDGGGRIWRIEICPVREGVGRKCDGVGGDDAKDVAKRGPWISDRKYRKVRGDAGVCRSVSGWSESADEDFGALTVGGGVVELTKCVVKA